MIDQADALRRLVMNGSITAKQKKAKIITVTSGKGGVGKSNFIVNLAISLKKQDKNVLIFDADIGMGNDDVLMGIYHKYNIMDVINGEVYIKDAIIEGVSGVHLLPGGSGLNKIEDLTKEQRDKFIKSIDEMEGYDYILIDTGAGINRSVLSFIASSEEVIFILTPEPTSLTDGYSLLKALSHFKINTYVNIVINRVLSEEEGKKTFEKFNLASNRFLNKEVNYLGYIFDDKKLTMAVRSQIPVVIKFPKSDVTKCIEVISNKLLGRESKIKGIGAKGLFNKLFDIFS